MSGNEKNIRSKILEIAEEVALQEGLEVVDVEIGGAPGKYIVRVYIDREGGVSMRDCVGFSRLLSTVLDVEDPVPTSYVLEVSSPGVNRVVRKPEHFKRYIGEKVIIRLETPMEGRKKVSGKIVNVSESGVVIEDGDLMTEVQFDNIKRANLKIIE